MPVPDKVPEPSNKEPVPDKVPVPEPELTYCPNQCVANEFAPQACPKGCVLVS